MKYKNVTKEDVLFLEKIVGEKNVIFGDAISEDYAKDELGTVKICQKLLSRLKQLNKFHKL